MWDAEPETPISGANPEGRNLMQISKSKRQPLGLFESFRLPCKFFASLMALALLCLFTASCGSGGSGSGNPPVAPPTIATQPSNQSVSVNLTATFTVVAAGTAPFSFQWQQGGTMIAGATSSSYTTPPVTMADNNSMFQVVVSNSAGSITSNPATLTVTNPVAPGITTQPANQSVNVNLTATF